MIAFMLFLVDQPLHILLVTLDTLVIVCSNLTGHQYREFARNAVP